MTDFPTIIIIIDETHYRYLFPIRQSISLQSQTNGQAAIIDALPDHHHYHRRNALPILISDSIVNLPMKPKARKGKNAKDKVVAKGKVVATRTRTRSKKEKKWIQKHFHCFNDKEMNNNWGARWIIPNRKVQIILPFIPTSDPKSIPIHHKWAVVSTTCLQ